MKYIISAFSYIIGSIFFLFLGIIVISLSFLSKPQKYDNFIKLLCRIFLKLFFIKVEVYGTEKIDPEKTYIFMSNHINIFDVFILYGYIPNFARGVELDSHFKWPVWGQVITRFGNIPISHTNLPSAIESLDKAQKAVNNGTSIIILPEGHRTKDGKLLCFMRGPFLLAQKTKADIVPTAMVGAFKIKKVTSWLVTGGTVKFVFDDTISYDKHKDLSSKELRDLVKNRTQKLLDDYNF